MQWYKHPFPKRKKYEIYQYEKKGGGEMKHTYTHTIGSSIGLVYSDINLLFKCYSSPKTVILSY